MRRLVHLLPRFNRHEVELARKIQKLTLGRPRSCAILN
jgi:hypothetical protein